MSATESVKELDLDAGFDLNGLRVQPTLNLIERPDGELRVEPKVMDVLVCLARRAGSVVSHDELVGEVWGEKGATADLVSRAIGKLRRALGDDTSRGGLIETVSKRGYVLRTVPRPIARPEPRSVSPAASRLRSGRHLATRMSPALASGLTCVAMLVLFGVACAL